MTATGVTTVVIVGATGDLARRKLVPALFNLRCKGRLGDGVRIVGFARTDLSDDGFCDLLRVGAPDLVELAVGGDEWRVFAQDIYYVPGNLDDPADLARLRVRLEGLEGGAAPANRVFYLSVAPSLYEAGVQGLGASGLAHGREGWRRVVIEKPFGRDLPSAQAVGCQQN